MRVLHVVKTSEGGVWAARQAAELVKSGVEVHVAVPSLWGAAMGEWHRSGARIHVCQLDLPASAPWRVAAASRDAQRLVNKICPDLIHSHFLGTTLQLRLALGKRHEVPRIFQVAGPLHMEHRLFRTLDLATAGPSDFWIGTSQCIVDAYAQAGTLPGRVFLSYHGGSASEVETARTRSFRRRLGIADDQYVVGNANYMYPPKRYLGQTTGIKRHEQVIDALRIVLEKRADVVGVLIGGVFGKGRWYEEQLRRRAESAGHGRILMPGYLRQAEILAAWPDFDCAVHTPISENCGGVIEPLLASVPTIASSVGGLPEVIKDGVTGKLIDGADPEEIAAAILHVLENLREYRAMAANGRALVRTMFNVQRTAAEVLRIYRHVLHPALPRPAGFDAAALLDRVMHSPIARENRQRPA